MAIAHPNAKITPTRFPVLSLAHLARGHWQFIANDDGRNATVGPVYSTQAEAMGDLESYAVRGGWVA